MSFTVWIVLSSEEDPIFERCFAGCAHEVMGVPLLIECIDTIPYNSLLTLDTFGSQIDDMTILTVGFSLKLEEWDSRK